ncbi:MAG: AzlD domain-containing protein [Rhodospirillales bacterium]|nr:AzlD domain-containing protein [Rhodospirillales bacterium]MDE2199617.1 AzlD domain-containing protein [Rhodospirillales bacterium]
MWHIDPWNLAAILGMALATYACRGGGYWLFRQIKPTPLLRAVLGHIPGTLFVSYVVPAVIAGGLQPAVGAAVTMVVMARTRSIMWAIFAGTGAAWIIWSLK